MLKTITEAQKKPEEQKQTPKMLKRRAQKLLKVLNSIKEEWDENQELIEKFPPLLLVVNKLLTIRDFLNGEDNTAGHYDKMIKVDISELKKEFEPKRIITLN